MIIIYERNSKLKNYISYVVVGSAALLLLGGIVVMTKPTKTVTENQTSYTATSGVIEYQNEALAKALATPVEVEKIEVDVVAEETPQWVEMDVPSHNGFKSYMDCKFITDVNSEQYKFKYEYLCSASGIMVVDSRYVVAVGSYYTTEIGARIDLVMENGSVVNCIVGDCKADKHTDGLNQQHSVDGSVVEFIVCTDNLSDKVRQMGDVSYANERLMGEIKSIRVYTEN